MSTNKKLLFRNISVYTIGSIVTQSLSVLLVPIYSKYLSTEDYGILSSMGLLSQVIFIFVTFNLSKSLYRCYWDYKTEYEKKVFFGTILISIFVLTTISIGGLFILNNYIARVYKSIPFYPYYMLMLLTIYLKPYYDILAIYYRIREESKKFLYFSLSYFIVNILLILFLVIVKNGGAAGSLLASFFTNVIFLVLSITIFKNKVVLIFDPSVLKNALAYSLPLIPNAIAYWVVNLSDRIIIERYFSLSEVGIYSMGYKLAGVLGILTTGFFTAYHPMFLRIANSDNKDSGLLFSINKIFIIGSIILTAILFIYSENITDLIIDSKFHSSYQIFRIIIVSNMIAIISSLSNLSLGQDKKMKSIMLIGVSGALLNILLNFLLIPIYGMYGAGYATVITFSFISIVTYYIAKKHTSFHIPLDWGTTILYLIIAIIVILICELFQGLLIKTMICIGFLLLFISQNKNILLRNIRGLL
jgi:O-antigen/teichoic acid export membrane protein